MVAGQRTLITINWPLPSCKMLFVRVCFCYMDYDQLGHSEIGMNILQYVFTDSNVPQVVAAAFSGYILMNVIKSMQEMQYKIC